MFGFRRLMLTGLLVKASAPFIYLIISTWPQLLALRLYHGLSTALYAPAASAQVAKLYPDERGSRLGLYSAAENAGVVLGAVLGAFVLSAAGFPVAFIVSGAIGVAALLAILPMPPDAPARERKQRLGEIVHTLGSGLRQIAGDRAVGLVSLMEATLYTGVGTFAGLSAALCRQRAHTRLADRVAVRRAGRSVDCLAPAHGRCGRPARATAVHHRRGRPVRGRASCDPPLQQLPGSARAERRVWVRNGDGHPVDHRNDRGFG